MTSPTIDYRRACGNHQPGIPPNMKKISDRILEIHALLFPNRTECYYLKYMS